MKPSVNVTINGRKMPNVGFHVSDRGMLTFNRVGLILRRLFMLLPGDGMMTVDYPYRG